MAIEAESLVQRLQTEFGYPEKGARIVAERVAGMSPAGAAAFEAWWTTGAQPALTAEGYDIDRLIREHGMNPIASLLTLDWLIREPERALASLRRGHDSVKRPDA